MTERAVLGLGFERDRGADGVDGKEIQGAREKLHGQDA